MIERYYNKLEEIREAIDVVTANNLLHEGYQLLTIRNKTIFEDDTQKTLLVYVFGKFTEEKQEENQTTEETTLRGYEDIDWHQKEDFQWAFHTDRDGKEIPSTHTLAQKINESEKGRFRLGDWEYRLSKDGKFITRRHIR